MSDIPEEFTASYYDEAYFVGSKGGKKFRTANGKIQRWSYFNREGEWLGCKPVVEAWKTMFNPKNALDVGAGRGTFVAYMRDVGIEAYGFDFSKFAIEHPYPRCKKEWLKLHDATKPWPYKDKSFDLVTALDFYEHIYVEDLDKVISEMFRVARKWIFLQIAVVGGGSGHGKHEEGYIIHKGEPVPAGLEGCAVAGHVTVQHKEFWFEKLDHPDWVVRRDMIEWFFTLVPEEVLINWKPNLLLVLERL